MTSHFKRIGLFGKPNALEAWETLGRVITFFKQHGCEVILDASCCPDFPHKRYGITQQPRETLIHAIDLGVVVGGDGSFLNAARDTVKADVPLLGINLGRLGFLADISPEQLEEVLSQILAGEYCREERTLLCGTIFYQDERVFHHLALNDIVIHKRDTPRMIEFDTFVDEHFVTRQRADGLIISTPTGSTAYALSAGGPIMDPRVGALTLVSINPHTLSNRPVVIPAQSMIRLKPHPHCTGSAKVTFDGQVTYEISVEHTLKVAAFEKKLLMIHPKDYNYYDILRIKMGWGGYRRC